ncbi:hypothetical protein [Peribacillus butanolivorans]|uniref:hypothetical protein n=1 Tax=Peribacillus butanolivorans TaxID=421767 RepID=UPI0037FDD570
MGIQPTYCPHCYSNPCCCPSNILFAFAEKSNIRLDLPQNGGLIVRTIPPFDTSGHIVKLEAMAEVAVQNGNPNYVVSIVIVLLRDGNDIARTSVVNAANTLEYITTPNITWVDIPPPGIHSYELLIAINTSPFVDERFVLTRTLTATLFPFSNVLPSTST